MILLVRNSLSWLPRWCSSPSRMLCRLSRNHHCPEVTLAGNDWRLMASWHGTLCSFVTCRLGVSVTCIWWFSVIDFFGLVMPSLTRVIRNRIGKLNVSVTLGWSCVSCLPSALFGRLDVTLVAWPWLYARLRQRLSSLLACSIHISDRFRLFTHVECSHMPLAVSLASAYFSSYTPQHLPSALHISHIASPFNFLTFQSYIPFLSITFINWTSFVRILLWHILMMIGYCFVLMKSLLVRRANPSCAWRSLVLLDVMNWGMAW